MNRTGFIALTGMAPVLAACAILASSSDSCSVDPKDRPFEVLSQPEVQEVPEEEANVIVQVTSSSKDAARTLFRISDDLAFDVELSPSPTECAHQPIHVFSYRVPPGRVPMTAVTNGQEDTKTTKVSTAPLWLVLQVQDGFPTRVRVYHREPAWG